MAMRLSLQAKLLAAFGLVILLTIVVGVIGVREAALINDSAAAMYSDDLVGTGRAADLALDLNLMRIKVLKHIDAGTPAKRAPLANDIASLDLAVHRTIASIRAANQDGDLRAPLAGFTVAWDRYTQTRDNLTLSASRAGHRTKALSAYNGPELKQLTDVSNALRSLIQAMQSAAQLTDSHNAASFQAARSLIIGVTLASILIGLTLAIVLARRIGGAVKKVARASVSLAKGNLEEQLDVHGNDEVGQMANAFRAMVVHQRNMAIAADAIASGDLSSDIQPQSERDTLGMAFQRMIARLRRMASSADAISRGDLSGVAQMQSDRDVVGEAFQRMVTNLRSLVFELQQGSQNLAGASNEILAMASQQAAGAHEQSAAISQTTATVAEVKASAAHAVQMAETVTETARTASGIAVDGVAAVNNATAGMADIRLKVQLIAENIVSLSEQTQQIGEIITTVNDLADQSNLLALNAAIEASRAGEHGKGFTVVANEIRTLAEQSKLATSQVRTILSDIQRATNAAVMATEQGTKGVDA
ncbi:MAG: mcp40H-21, partial [Chloroflexi bacterium]|nr:mcp40H-21 [Chloroflexota bacterium]